MGRAVACTVAALADLTRATRSPAIAIKVSGTAIKKFMVVSIMDVSVGEIAERETAGNIHVVTVASVVVIEAAVVIPNTRLQKTCGLSHTIVTATVSAGSVIRVDAVNKALSAITLVVPSVYAQTDVTVDAILETVSKALDGLAIGEVASVASVLGHAFK